MVRFQILDWISYIISFLIEGIERGDGFHIGFCIFYGLSVTVRMRILLQCELRLARCCTTEEFSLTEIAAKEI